MWRFSAVTLSGSNLLISTKSSSTAWKSRTSKMVQIITYFKKSFVSRENTLHFLPGNPTAPMRTCTGNLSVKLVTAACLGFLRHSTIQHQAHLRPKLRKVFLTTHNNASKTCFSFLPSLHKNGGRMDNALANADCLNTAFCRTGQRLKSLSSCSQRHLIAPNIQLLVTFLPTKVAKIRASRDSSAATCPDSTSSFHGYFPRAWNMTQISKNGPKN